MTKVAVVVPTIRPDLMEDFMVEWADDLASADAKLYVVQDNQVTWDRMREELGEAAEIISTQSDGIRCYGFLQALRDGADVILSLDDDVRPSGNTIDDHLDMLFDRI